MEDNNRPKADPEAPTPALHPDHLADLRRSGLSDETIRDAAKEFAGWPTFPQVYVRGEFIGGNDIVTEMYAEGELHELVKRIAS